VFHKLLTAVARFGLSDFPEGRRAFPIGLAINDELMSPMTETVQSALAEKGLIKNSHPFVDGSV
jgi:hypothetical protein